MASKDKPSESIHTHFCPEPYELGGHRYGCSTIFCTLADIAECPEHEIWDPAEDYDPLAEHTQEEVRAMIAATEV